MYPVTVLLNAAVSVLVGPRCPALLNCINADVHTAVLLGKLNDDDDDDDDDDVRF